MYFSRDKQEKKLIVYEKEARSVFENFFESLVNMVYTANVERKIERERLLVHQIYEENGHSL